MLYIHRCAVDEYTRGNYAAARGFYQQLATQIGEKNFRANIQLCEKKIGLSRKPKKQSSTLLKEIRVAAVMDEFTYHSYSPECKLLQLTPDNAIDELVGFNPELLFIESAWRGKDDLWGSKVGHKSAELIRIVDWCRARAIPTVFWNKEDPVHFETFLSTAQLFDFVFTTDIDCIHRYKAALKHDRVYLLPFACQPQHSNPIEKYPRKDAFCFAGAYYVRYPERTRDLGNFMTALAEYKPVEIYDRNFGKNDPNYQFPPEYAPYIVGNLPFDQIDKAYKGYQYAINLNSIKQSQSMFARRVFELLASNTIAVSNFSRGVRLLFGDLVITSDNGKEIVRRVQTLVGNEVNAHKFRLVGLRKVMQNHTYQDRLGYIVSKINGTAMPDLLPSVAATAFVNQQSQLNKLLSDFGQQTYEKRSLVILLAQGFVPESKQYAENIHFFNEGEGAISRLADLPGKPSYIAGMVADDDYGPNYLLDLVLATRYSNAHAIGKACHYAINSNGAIALVNTGCQYQWVEALSARCSIIDLDHVGDVDLQTWATRLHLYQIRAEHLLAVDEFNYCRNGAKVAANHLLLINDLTNLDVGISAHHLRVRAENIQPEKESDDSAPVWLGSTFATYFKPPSNRGYQFNVVGKEWCVLSELADGKHDYIYANTDFRPNDLGFKDQVRFHLDATPGLNLQLAVVFLDAKKQRISNVVKSVNRNHEAVIPPGTEWIRLGVRLYGSGASQIKALVLGHRPLRPAEVLGRAEHLVLTNHYPSDDDLYRNGFVHSRVAAYAERGVRVDVFRLRKDEALSYHEFHNVDVITGSQEALSKLLNGGHYKSVLVHFLDEAMWQVLQHIEKINIFVWVHGAEIQPWHRRDNFDTEQQREGAKLQSAVRMNFWKELLKEMPKNLKLIFVSKYLAEVVMEDLGFQLPKECYEIIHNPIDTDLFAYSEKLIKQRKKILSIRPYASRTYANDLSVNAILALAAKPYFNEFEIRIVGDGKLFEETLEPLRQFSNVCIERRFLAHEEIAALHREYGIFLCPSRMDTQGVSRDEAMSSGLIPITNAVGAIPEFIDESCSILAASEDAEAMAAGIASLYENPQTFQAMSKAAAGRVRRQTAKHKIIDSELKRFINFGSVQ